MTSFTYQKLDVDDWNLSGCAEIISIDNFAKIRSRFRNVVVTSGGYDNLHAGHISSIMESARLFKINGGDALVVIVNGDAFLTKKKGKPFMPLKDRCQIVSAIRHVDFIIPYESPVHMDVSEALAVIKPTIFTKGGDRTDSSNIPEWKVCEEIGCKIVSGVGLPKYWSSSNYLNDWAEFKIEERLRVG